MNLPIRRHKTHETAPFVSNQVLINESQAILSIQVFPNLAAIAAAWNCG
jgi:hypothetical protein